MRLAKDRLKICQLFVENKELKFNQIQKQTKIDSNKLSYYLNNLIKDEILQKSNDSYSLTKQAERFLPLITSSQNQPLPIVLVAVTNEDEILLLKREKRPYKDYWGLIGGKMNFEESIEQTALRLTKEKTGLQSKFISTNAILHEQVKEEDDDYIKHSFILFFTKVETDSKDIPKEIYNELEWFKENNLTNLIPSDLHLIQTNLNTKVQTNNAVLIDKDDKITEFKLLD